ncbi:MAG: ribosomal large subunit pseudouridine synthase [Rhodocyclaceae bacterium]|nr:ribosomal large subunit pseudouridine synthase [Rhodocyclaceae bacterium]
MNRAGRNSVTHVVIGDEEAGQRLDNYLVRCCKGVPKSHLYRILRSGEVRVNSGRVDATYRLQAGDSLRIPPIRVAERHEDEAQAVAKQRVELPVIFEDDALLAINKPEGVAVHGGSGVSFGVIEALRQQRPQAKFLELAHRLDRETSGILLVGKKRLALTALHDMFREHGQGADKRYLVLVKGRWMNGTQHVRLPLHKYLTEGGERRVSVDPDGKSAHTVFRLLARWQSASLLEAQLKTGRTHQIRVHLAHLGFPILGDEKYGDFALNKALKKDVLKRMALHAWRMAFRHPLSGEPLELRAPLPEALAAYVAVLSNNENVEFAADNLEQILAGSL